VDQVGRFDTSLRINSDYQYWLRASLVTEFGYIDRPLVDERRSNMRLTGAKAEGTVLQYGMLLDFYHRLGGSRSIRPALARRVLARSAFRAARQLRREGYLSEAREMFGKSLAHRWTPRAQWGWWRAGMHPGQEIDKGRRVTEKASPMELLIANVGHARWRSAEHSQER
jgi:hypothetical protein